MSEQVRCAYCGSPIQANKRSCPYCSAVYNPDIKYVGGGDFVMSGVVGFEYRDDEQ